MKIVKLLALEEKEVILTEEKKCIKHTNETFSLKINHIEINCQYMAIH
jgi:hypothetical protein